VSTSFAEARGRIGRSWGCPALAPQVASRVIDAIKGGSAMFAYYPDSSWLASSQFLQQPVDPAPDAFAFDSAFVDAPTLDDGSGPGFRARLAEWKTEILSWASAIVDRIA